MSANINTYIGRQSAWHKLGTTTEKYFSWKEALEHGGLDFDVFKSQLHDGLGRTVDAYGVFRWDKSAQVAGDKSAAIFLGTVGQDYKVINHANGFNLIDALVRSNDGAHYETVGVLGKGEVVWGLADLGLTIKVGDDHQKPFLLFSTSHDGSRAHDYRTCVERVVCQNTLNVALGEKTKANFKIRHTTNAGDRIIEAHKTLTAIGDDIKSVEDKLNILAQRKANRESVTGLMDKLFPRKMDLEGVVQKDSTRRENIIGDILKIYELNDANVFPEQRGTLYNLLNAVTNYTDHERSTVGNGNGRAESALFGSGDRLKGQAFEYLLTSAKTAEALPTKQVYISDGMSTGSSILDGLVEATVGK
jgi:phage/plasmid-like protein (TIGR03299 family)